MNAPPPFSRLALVASTAVAGLLALRLWSVWCSFPIHAWNEIRLAPTFMLAAGENPYPSLAEGPVTTWIYGPVPLLVHLPALLADSAGTALLIAGALNLLVAGMAVWLGVNHATRNHEGPARRTGWAMLLCLALWPGSSLQYIQADNLAVLFALASNALLSAQSGPGRSRLAGMAGAACAVLAVCSKQTFAPLILGQVIWLVLTTTTARALGHALACGAYGLVAAAGFAAWFGARGLWLNLFELPFRLPYWADPVDRATGLAWHLAGYVVLPAVVLLLGRHRVWRRDSPWLLPALGWLCLLPTALLACFKLGGTANSLHVFLLLLPTASVAAWDRLRARGAWVSPLFLVVTALAAQLSFLRELPHRPLAPATRHLDQAAYLARELAGEVYFPWNPLVTYFQERRFHHVEDGLYVRIVAGLPPDKITLARHLPADWSVTVFRGNDEGWGIVRQMQPPATVVTPFGGWTLHSWPKPASAAQNSPPVR